MFFDQSPYGCRVEWGVRGAREAAVRGDIVIVVDVFSFSSTVTAATALGATVYPYRPPLDAEAARYASSIGAELALGRAEAARVGGRSLSPVGFGPHDAGRSFVLCSLNGAACVDAAKRAAAVVAGCLLNATAAAAYANALQARTGAPVTIVPCGERWEASADDGGVSPMRPSIEDYLGAGLIASKLSGSKSPEAEVCIGAFLQSERKLQELLWDCGSGRELRLRGYADDVAFSSRIDAVDTVPVLDAQARFVPADELQ